MMVSDIWPPFCPIHMDSSLSPRERRIIAGSRKKSLSHNIHEKFRNPKAALLRNRRDRDTKEICLSLRREASVQCPMDTKWCRGTVSHMQHVQRGRAVEMASEPSAISGKHRRRGREERRSRFWYGLDQLCRDP